MRESIILSAIRSFFVALFGVTGVLFGFVLVAALFGAFSMTTEGAPELTYTYTPEIKANADGIRKEESKTAPVILKLNIDGAIGLDSLTNKKMAQLLIESRERDLADNRVKAILLYINSPGGTVIDADGIYNEIKAYKEKHKVPVYAFIDGLGASGGYYIATAADKIFASNSSLIGSVGVLMPTTMNFSQLMDKIGVQSMTLYDGKGKDNLNPFRPWRKGEEDNIKSVINYYYDMFVDIVTTNRPHMDKTKLVDIYGANVYPPTLAKEYGFIDDHNMSLNSTLKLLAEDLGIHDDDYQVVELESNSWLSALFTSKFDFLTGVVKHQLDLTPGLPPQFANQFLYFYHP